MNSACRVTSGNDGKRVVRRAETRHPSPVTYLARIELGPTEIPRFLGNGVTTKVAEALKKIGYAHVTLDLQGYRRGGVEPGA